MLIETPIPITIVEEYDIVTSSGQCMPLTINPKLGDKIDLTDKDVIRVYLSPKPSLHDPTKTFPAEYITIFTKYIISIQQRQREVKDLTTDQKTEWPKEVSHLGKSAH